jgi:spermidine synthase
MALPDYDFLAYEQSPIGMIGLRRRTLESEPGAVVTEITLDHTLLMSSCNSASERALVSAALVLHRGQRLDVLVGGLGLGCTAHEALLSKRVARLEIVEFLPQVIEWLDRDLLPLAAELRADTRLAVQCGDVYGRLAGAPKRLHDLILIDVDHSPDEPLGAASESFYSAVGLERAKGHLRPGGVLGVWSYAESPRFEASLRQVFDQVRVERATFWNRITDEEETHWLLFAWDENA